jgi:ElaB/YqjD/DUF883 family membrane-anchored ribosome-binding protein
MPDTREVRDSIDHVRRLLEETTTGGAEVLGAASAAQRSLEDELADAERKIRENPLGAVLVAAGVGLVLGLLIRRR